MPSITHVFMIAGCRMQILFRKRGYTPHFAEYVDDPLTGDRVVVMADPHTRRSAFIYHPEKKQIIWEHRVTGSQLTSNPHIARLITEPLPAFNAKPGDIVCADLDNRYIVIDRKTKSVKWSTGFPDAKWAHDIMPTKDHEHVLTTDYGNGMLRRIDGSGKIIWSRELGKGLAKLSRVVGQTPSTVHSNSFGGDVLAAVNQDIRGVYELREEDGEVVWSCPPLNPSRNCTWTLKPHAAVRMGLAELDGNLTVFNQEAGGGFVAVDKDCRPRWGVSKPLSLIDGRPIYRPTAQGLFETTHVFLTPNGFLGLIDWDGDSYSTVYELLEPPRGGTLTWLLAWNHETAGVEEFLDPPIETYEWRETMLHVINHGEGRLKLRLLATHSPIVDTGKTWEWSWFTCETLSVEPGGHGEARVDGFSAVRVAASSEGRCRYSIFVVNRG